MVDMSCIICGELYVTEQKENKMFKNRNIDKLVELKVKLDRLTDEYNRVRNNFVDMYGEGEHISDRSKVLVTKSIRTNVSWSKVVKEHCPDVDLDPYTTQSETTIVNVKPLVF